MFVGAGGLAGVTCPGGIARRQPKPLNERGRSRIRMLVAGGTPAYISRYDVHALVTEVFDPETNKTT